MKLKFHHPEPSARELAGPRYWRSLDDLAQTPAFKEWVAREFPAGAGELDGVNRRGFLKIMAASFGLAGLGMAGCHQPTKHLLPYSKQTDRIVPGVPIFYTSSLPGAEENLPLIVETHDARPTKVEGNPSYAPYAGATDTFAQSSILDLYDPDRAQRSSGSSGGPEGAPISAGQVLDKLGQIATRYAANGGAGLAFLTGRSSSPTRARLVARLRARYPQAMWAEYEAVDQGNPERAATAWFNSPARPVYDFSKARRILALESDFLHGEPGHLSNARGYAAARRVQNAADADPAKMNRLYAVESNFSLTGAAADHRLRCATSHVTGVAALFAAEFISQALTGAQYQAVAATLRQSGAPLLANPDYPELEKWIRECAADLVAHPGAAVVIAGADLPVQVHYLAMLMNVALQSVGSTVSYKALPARPAAAGIRDVAAALDAKSLTTLVVLDGNPAYDAPGDLAFAAKLQAFTTGGGELVRYGYYGRNADETSALATTFIAGLHYLESWGDGLTYDGRHVPVQPMILPLFEGLGQVDVLSVLGGDATTEAYQQVRATFTALHPGQSFDEWLAVGVAGAGFGPVSGNASLLPPSLLANWNYTPPALNESTLELRFVPGMAWDGRYANNGWLQECPDPMTQLTWDNAILISPRLGKQLGLWPDPSVMAKLHQSAMPYNQFDKGYEIGRVGEITVLNAQGQPQTIRGPVSILPGLANWSLVVALGYGRTVVGRVGEKVGFSAYPLVPSTGALTCAVAGVGLKLLPESFKLANVQEHWAMEGRELVRESSVEDYVKDPHFAQKLGVEAHSPPIYGPDQDQSLQYKTVNQPRGQSLYELTPYNKPAPNYPAWNTPEGLARFPTPQQWGMSIDLNTCLACNACVVACQAENNIPIVGKEQVLRGREMHWIRMDRYFASPPVEDGHGHAHPLTTAIPEDPQVNFQSVACMHCELAPCENVCPFTATVHDDQGLNTMAYNRCVGTKYCANNCPYKVRRFNFFDWNKRKIGHFYEGPLGPENYDMTGGNVSADSALTRMQKNPDVSVRMRGVMEKCTYCVQRIEEAKINQRVKARDSGDIKVPDGVIKTACQQVCPTGAIQFGDIADTETAVYQAKQSDRDYAVLGYLNIRPRTTYQAKLRNPNPAMPVPYAQPYGRQEFDARYGHSASAHAAPAAGEGAPAAAAPAH